MDIGIIGTGNMGSALSRRLVMGGQTVYVASRTDEHARNLADELASAPGPGSIEATSTMDAAARSEVTVLAVPFEEATKLAVQLSDTLTGKVVVDMTNPFNENFDELVTDPTTCAGEEIQRRIPQGQVVKAFNTIFAPVLAEGELNGIQGDVFVASDNEDAKGVVADLVRSGGLRPVDAGALKNARTLERLALLSVELTFRYDLNFQSGIKMIPLLLPTDRVGASTG